MKIFFCDGNGKDKYGNPEKSDYTITFEKFFLEIEFPYKNENGQTKDRVMPRSWILDDDALLNVKEISLISEDKIPIKFKRIFILLVLKTDLSIYENFK